jgi:hypothetical protein
MFGDRKKRVEKLSAGAKANLEDGESIRELVQTRTGQSRLQMPARSPPLRS